MTGNGHKPGCDCGLCRVMAQVAKGAKTTKEDRVYFTLHLTKEERKRLGEVAKEAGLSAKAFAEAAVRSAID